MPTPRASVNSLPVAALAERLLQASAHQCEYGAMWRAVIVQAAFDAYLSCAKHRDGLAARDDARTWFGTDDFASVCDLAGLEPDWALAHVARFASYVARNGVAERHREMWCAGRPRRRARQQAGSLRGRFPAHHAHQAEG